MSAATERSSTSRRCRTRDDALRRFGLAPYFRTNLQATIERFNGFARSGRDEDFARGETDVEIWWHCLSLFYENFAVGDVTIVRDPVSANVDESGRRYPNPTMRPLRPPYYAVILSQGLQDTKGGPAIDAGAACSTPRSGRWRDSTARATRSPRRRAAPTGAPAARSGPPWSSGTSRGATPRCAADPVTGPSSPPYAIF